MEFRHKLKTEDEIPYIIEVWNNDGIIKLEDTEDIYYLSDLVNSIIQKEYPFN